MVKPLFDSCILIDYLNGIDEARRELRLWTNPAISVICWMEVMSGAAPESADATRKFLRGFDSVPINEVVAEAAVLIRRQRRLRLPDAIVWASAMTTDRLLVTRDQKAFPLDDPGVRFPYML